MSKHFLKSFYLPESPLWGKLKKLRRQLFSFDLELTARCNSNCRHCYINLPVNDRHAKDKELTIGQIERIADEAVSLGALWCLITGGEPLLRKDFSEIYLSLKKKGLLVSVFTNATLITKKHIWLFKRYPPRDIEVTVYGVTQDTYERITQTPGSFKRFMRGLNLLLKNDIKIRLKTMALCSNVNELPKIASFCRKLTKDYFRFDPILHLRYDLSSAQNKAIKSERLSPLEIATVEQADSERFHALQKACDKLINPAFAHKICDHLFHCSAGNGNFSISYDGFFRLCPSLWHPDCIYDLKKGSLAEAWHTFAPAVQDMRSNRKEFLTKCHTCPIVNLCLWCPAQAHLETRTLDAPVEYFCEVAHARAKMLQQKSLER